MPEGGAPYDTGSKNNVPNAHIMQYEARDITHTLGARLMAIQVGLIAEKLPHCRPEEREHAFDRLLKGPDAQLLYSTWSDKQRRDFQQYMMTLRDSIGVPSH